MSRMEKNTRVAYVAGLFDGAGFVGASYKQSFKYTIGYHVELILQINARQPETMGLLDEFCEDYDLSCTFRETNSGAYVWRITVIDDIEKFLDLLSEHLVENFEDAYVMVNELIPSVRDREHLSEEGLIEIAGHIDNLSGGRSRRRYTQDYFVEEFEDSEK